MNPSPGGTINSGGRMDSPGAIDWAPLFSLLHSDVSEPELVTALLKNLSEGTEATGVALYLFEEGRFRLETDFGAGPFPDLLEESAPEGSAQLDLPGGRLLVRPPRALEVLAEGGSAEARALLALGLKLCDLRRQLKRRQFEAGLKGVEQQALYEVGLAITSMLDLDALSEAILSWALSLLDARRAALYLYDQGAYKLRQALGGAALEGFEPASLQALPSDLLPGAVYLLAVPMEIESSPRGLLVVADKESRHGVRPFASGDQQTLKLFAHQAAIALENAHLHRQALEKERLEREMELAGEIQRQILPKSVPQFSGYEMFGWNRPARHIGGDYFNFLERQDGHLTLTLGDVSGKGMPAALMVSILHSALRLMLDVHEVGPTLGERLNRHVHESTAPAKYITLLVGDLDLASRRLGYLNAGHNPGVVLGRDGQVRQLGATGMPIGLLPVARYERGEVRLIPGDLVCFYSDGITEASDLAGEEFGLDRLVELLREHRDLPLEAIVHELEQAATCFAQGQPQGDDQTILLLRVKDESCHHPL